MESYFNLVGDKACCFEDLRPYLSLEGEDRARWTSFLESITFSSVSIASQLEIRKLFTDVLQANLSDLRRSINVHALLRHSLSPTQITPEMESSRATQYLKHYLDGLKLGEGLPSTELQPVDDFAILAGQAFINVWKLADDETQLYNAASVLEFGLTKSKHSYQIRLMLVRIYTLLGAYFRDVLFAVIHRHSLNGYDRCTVISTRALPSSERQTSSERYSLALCSFASINILTGCDG
jgi:N-terminal acetyltransferase B complex non-catalytic subunit